MSRPPDDHGIEHEPHLRPGGFTPDPSEAKAAVPRARGDDVEHTVWDEPALDPRLSGRTPADALTYERWLVARHAATSPAKTWAVTFGIILAAGPWALLGALIGSPQLGFQVVMITVFGPLVEEIMKIALALWVVEKHPYLFRSRGQIALCALAGGLVFAVIENLIYLNIYIPDPPASLVQWRWTICVALHMGCSFIAAMGLMRIWSGTHRRRARPRMADGATYFIVAVVVHGAYNGLCIALEFLDYHF